MTYPVAVVVVSICMPSPVMKILTMVSGVPMGVWSVLQLIALSALATLMLGMARKSPIRWYASVEPTIAAK